jgi:biopolymer transport protein ExbB/TolQ
MWPILFWSILTIGIIVERALYLFGSSINKDVFLATMQKCILAGDVAKAVKMCSAANAPLARIVQAGLVKVNRPDEEVQAAMDEAALRELPKIAPDGLPRPAREPRDALGPLGHGDGSHQVVRLRRR